MVCILLDPTLYLKLNLLKIETWNLIDSRLESYLYNYFTDQDALLHPKQ